MLLDIFQTFLEQLFSRQLWTATIIYNLFYFEKQSTAKKVFLKISQSLQENICVRVSFLIKLKAWGLHMWLWHRCFLQILWNFWEHLRWLLRYFENFRAGNRVYHLRNQCKISFVRKSRNLYKIFPSWLRFFCNLLQMFVHSLFEHMTKIKVTWRVQI